MELTNSASQTTTSAPAGHLLLKEKAFSAVPPPARNNHLLSQFCRRFSSRPDWITGGFGSQTSHVTGFFSSCFSSFTSCTSFRTYFPRARTGYALHHSTSNFSLAFCLNRCTALLPPALVRGVSALKRADGGSKNAQFTDLPQSNCRVSAICQPPLKSGGQERLRR